MGKVFGFIGHDFLDLSWDQARGYLREELEQLRSVLNRSRVNLGNTLDIQGRIDYSNLPEAEHAPSVIGTPVNGDFREIKVGSGINITNNTLNIAQSQLPFSTAGYQLEDTHLPIPIGIQGTQPPTSTSTQSAPQVPLVLLEDREYPWPIPTTSTDSTAAADLVSWVPLSLGVEPLQFVSDGAGSPIFVTFSA
jgi:hypothetical protein